jgi:hypothetical protein
MGTLFYHAVKARSSEVVTTTFLVLEPQGQACFALLLERLMLFRAVRVAVEGKANHLESKSVFENCLSVEKPGYNLLISFSVTAWPGVNDTAGRTG